MIDADEILTGKSKGEQECSPRDILLESLGKPLSNDIMQAFGTAKKETRGIRPFVKLVDVKGGGEEGIFKILPKNTGIIIGIKGEF